RGGNNRSGKHMDLRSPIRAKEANALGRGWFFALIGGALLLGAAIGCLYSAVRWGDAERTEGTVVALEDEFDEDGVAYYPVVEYDVGGQRFRCKGSFGFGPARYRVGERVGVLYQAGQQGAAQLMAPCCKSTHEIAAQKASCSGDGDTHYCLL